MISSSRRCLTFRDFSFPLQCHLISALLFRRNIRMYRGWRVIRLERMIDHYDHLGWIGMNRLGLMYGINDCVLRRWWLLSRLGFLSVNPFLPLADDLDPSVDSDLLRFRTWTSAKLAWPSLPPNTIILSPTRLAVWYPFLAGASPWVGHSSHVNLVGSEMSSAHISFKAVWPFPPPNITRKFR